MNNTFEDKVFKLLSLRRQREELDAQIEKLESELKDSMNSLNEYEHHGETWKLSWNIVESTRFDQKKFKLEHPKLYKKYTVPNVFRRFLLFD